MSNRRLVKLPPMGDVFGSGQQPESVSRSLRLGKSPQDVGNRYAAFGKLTA